MLFGAGLNLNSHSNIRPSTPGAVYDDSAYVELQAGLFRNQETYGFLEPQETVRFTEYWLPVRAIGGITRATLDAVFNAERLDEGSRLSLGLNVTRDLQNARVRLRQDDRALLDATVTLPTRKGAMTSSLRRTYRSERSPSIATRQPIAGRPTMSSIWDAIRNSMDGGSRRSRPIGKASADSGTASS